MTVETSDFDGRLIGQAELTKGADGQLRLDGEVIHAIQVIGSRVALVLLHRQVCVATTDYVAVRRSAGAEWPHP
jgi:hypothetical protein